MEQEKATGTDGKVVSIAERRLTAMDIIGTQDFVERKVAVPEWGGFVTVRSLSAEEAFDFTEKLKTNPGMSPVKVLVKSLVDEKGGRLFTEDQVELLAKKSMGVITRLQDVVLELNGMGKYAEQAQAAAKNG